MRPSIVAAPMPCRGVAIGSSARHRFVIGSYDSFSWNVPVKESGFPSPPKT
jgi:hypothetical protein